MAKASLNMQTASLAADFKANKTNISIVAVHPGRVPTDLSGGKGDVDLVESVKGMVKIIEGMDMGSSRRFLYYNGEEMSW
jgi:NAD(P)-dependent dehydrogenase (short-subunit alcohol dehydrogenase family)